MNMTAGRMCLTCVLSMLTLGLACVSASGQAQSATDQAARWSEQAHGMSLTPPPGAAEGESVGDGALVRFLIQDSAKISVFIRRTTTPLNLKAVKDKALREFSFAYPSAVAMAQDTQPISPAGRQGIGLYMLAPDDQSGDWVFAQVFMLIDQTTLAIFQLECGADSFDSSQSAFADMIDSVDLADPAELDRVRSKRLTAGQAWLDSLTTEQIKQAAVPERWMRILRDGKDIGYLRVRQTDEAEHVPPGIGVSVRSRIIDGNNTYDTEGTFFEADDRSVEFWTITTTLRSEQTGVRDPDAPSLPNTQSWRQTGLRDGDRIEVSQESPGSIKKLPWTKPPTAYLSQVDLFALPALLPRDQPAVLAFYAFNRNAHKLSLRTLRIEPMPEGGYHVFDRPTPDSAEQVATYDRYGKLLECVMPDGQTFIATTPREIRRLWGVL